MQVTSAHLVRMASMPARVDGSCGSVGVASVREVLRGRRHVLLDDGHRRRHVALLDGVDDRRVPVRDIIGGVLSGPPFMIAPGGGVAAAVGQLCQRLPQPGHHCPPFGRGGDLCDRDPL